MLCRVETPLCFGEPVFLYVFSPINAPLCFVEPLIPMLLIVQGRYGVSKVIKIMNLVQRE
jgi:hypothetical protein